MTFRKNYFILTALLFVIEVLIALYVHDAIIRPYVGDLLVVILMYCFVRSFFHFSVMQAAVGTLLFAYLIEVLQYFHLVEKLGLQESRLANIVLGNLFQPIDLIAYTLGFIIVLIVERKKIRPKNAWMLFALLLVIILSCNDKKTKTISTSPQSAQLSSSIRFDFAAKFVEEEIDVDATLYNDDADTVYFITASCEGEIYSLRFDVSKFRLMPRISCNASFPEKHFIPPGGRYDFKAYFYNQSNQHSMRMGFALYQVTKNFDVEKLTLRDINTHHKNMLWAEEKIIQ